MNIKKTSIKAKIKTKGINSLSLSRSCEKKKRGFVPAKKKNKKAIHFSLSLSLSRARLQEFHEEIVIFNELEREVTNSPPNGSSLFKSSPLSKI